MTEAMLACSNGYKVHALRKHQIGHCFTMDIVGERLLSQPPKSYMKPACYIPKPLSCPVCTACAAKPSPSFPVLLSHAWCVLLVLPHCPTLPSQAAESCMTCLSLPPGIPPAPQSHFADCSAESRLTGATANRCTASVTFSPPSSSARTRRRCS